MRKILEYKGTSVMLSLTDKCYYVDGVATASLETAKAMISSQKATAKNTADCEIVDSGAVTVKMVKKIKKPVDTSDE